MRLLLPGGTLAVFRRRRCYARGDVVLVDHPERGRIVRRVFAVGRKGRYSLEALNRKQPNGLGMIEPDWIRGAMSFRLL